MMFNKILCLFVLAFVFSLCIKPSFTEVSRPASFEDAYKNSGKRTVEYMEPDAFSPARLAEGKAAFENKCAVCHTDSGRDMVMFGNPDFSPARVIGSVKKFAGAVSDPELGEKVYEYLRYSHPGPFTSQHDPFLQPGPLSLEPGSSNPVLSNPGDFWGALTGHRVPAPEDVDISRVWDSYEWPRVIMPFKLLGWSQFMPHSVPLLAARGDTRELFKKQKFNLADLPLPDRGFGKKFNGGISKIYTRYQFSSHDKDKADHSRDNLEGVYASSYLNWLAVQDFDYGLPRWENGKWKGEWAFGPFENPILWKAGTSLVHLNLHAINPAEKMDSRTLNRNGWTHYSNMFVTGKEEHFTPSPHFYGATMPWSCKAGDTGRYGGQDAQIFTGLKHFAEMWNHSQNYPEEQYPGTGSIPHYGNATRRHLLSIYTPYTGMQSYRGNKETIVNILLEMVYRQWKASIGATGADLRTFYGLPEYEAEEKDQQRFKALASTYDILQGTLTERQKEFVRAYIRRLYPVSPENFADPFKAYKWELFEKMPGKPVVLPFGSDTATVGKLYRLRILRAQALDGDIEITAGNLPEGARLVKSKGKWVRDDYDYAIEWTPAGGQGNKDYTITLRGTSNMGVDETTAVIRVEEEKSPPVLDSVPEHSVFVGQELTFPLTVRNSRAGDRLCFSMEGDLGRAVNNSWNTAGIYTVKPSRADVGQHTVTFTVADGLGNRSGSTARINVYDNHPPSISVSPGGSGPGPNKNIYRVRVGETLRLTLNAPDPDGDPVEISKNPDFPGYINGNTYSYTVEEDMARHFPGPNVLTFTARDIESGKGGPRSPKYKGGEGYRVLLVYFEPADSGLNHNPWAVAGPNQTVKPGDTVTLDASASDDTDGDAVTYRWEQVSGPPVMISDVTSPKPSFVAPDVTEDAVIKFYLTVTDPGGLSDLGVVRVRVLGGPAL